MVWMNCCSVKSRSTPVSGSDVRLAEKLTPHGPDQPVEVGFMAPLQGGERVAGAEIVTSCGWPDKARFMSGSGPAEPIIQGVWQSWHPAIDTRYSPRFTCAPALS